MKLTINRRSNPEVAIERPTLVEMRGEHPEPEDHKNIGLIYSDQQLHELVSTIHTMTLDDDEFSPERIQGLKPERKRTDGQQYVQPIITRKIDELFQNPAKRVPLTYEDRESVIEAVSNEILGFGILEPLLDDNSISDILVNTYNQIYVERRGKGTLELLPAVRFRDNDHLKNTIDRIVNEVNRKVDEISPMVDARIDRRLPDGRVQRVRLNAIIEPLSIEGPMLSIRKFPQDHMTLWNLVENGSLTQEMADLLKGICQAKLNVLIAGGTGSGKTTLLNALSGAIPSHERIITIEDIAELHLQQKHVVRLETRPPSPNIDTDDRGEITQRDLVKNSLRMRPDRIIVGEVRGDEALDMLQAMNTGHEGSLTTIHANSGRDALSRLETMVAMASGNTSSRFIRQSISRAFDVVLYMSRIGDDRKVTSMQEITGMQNDVISLQEIFAFEQTGLDNGRVRGTFQAKGLLPEFLQKFEARSIPMPPYSMFNAA